MHYRRAAEQNTRDTHDQIKAKEEENITTTFTSGEYASLCRGDTSKVPVLSLLPIVLPNFEQRQQTPLLFIAVIEEWKGLLKAVAIGNAISGNFLSG